MSAFLPPVARGGRAPLRALGHRCRGACLRRRATARAMFMGANKKHNRRAEPENPGPSASVDGRARSRRSARPELALLHRYRRSQAFPHKLPQVTQSRPAKNRWICSDKRRSEFRVVGSARLKSRVLQLGSWAASGSATRAGQPAELSPQALQYCRMTSSSSTA